mmetsp:Transcript_58768/g.140065  ORF Transcript_58768/g.140065 Transcript_58768/m.140065 type:complete len:266 (-) Transcript_58768:225-1022(-)|eukprot:CAMPEP_0178376608 /NCGR_PEP_ID=MMETSP0689_2-20121128/3490_1 /TAXON_ID=160604 /ORGANISM="Amphidinium massartii, Strain CS-259" /LENGTH=265 /DNA_ID=CAMNT_0019996635 /DNA_START=36 /DNA_END=833 /DNA_ORIENTATION=+
MSSPSMKAGSHRSGKELAQAEADGIAEEASRSSRSNSEYGHIGGDNSPGSATALRNGTVSSSRLRKAVGSLGALSRCPDLIEKVVEILQEDESIDLDQLLQSRDSFRLRVVEALRTPRRNRSAAGILEAQLSRAQVRIMQTPSAEHCLHCGGHLYPSSGSQNAESPVDDSGRRGPSSSTWCSCRMVRNDLSPLQMVADAGTPQSKRSFTPLLLHNRSRLLHNGTLSTKAEVSTPSTSNGMVSHQQEVSTEAASLDLSQKRRHLAL